MTSPRSPGKSPTQCAPSTAKRLTVVYRSTIRPGTIDGLIIPIFKSALGDTDGLIEIVYNPEFLREATAVHDFYTQAPDLVRVGDFRAWKLLSTNFVNSGSRKPIVNVGAARVVETDRESLPAVKPVST